MKTEQNIKNTITQQPDSLNTPRLGRSNTPRHHKLFGGSSYDRYLDVLLFMWPDILKAVPDAQLHITYGWDLFDKVAANNPERMKWKDNVNKLMNQQGIFHHGRLGKDELAKVRKSCGVWAYPTYFQEINCITALDCQNDGLVPVTMTLAALKETVRAGILIEGDIHVPEVEKRFVKELTRLLLDEKRWLEESKKAQNWAKKFVWSNIALKWNDIFKKPLITPEVSVITISMREGWWNLQAFNLMKQTYKIKEWIIIDDYPKDRSKIAKQTADLYKLNIKYIRNDKVYGDYSRPYGFQRAVNKGWQAATGELLVWYQDFIIMPKDGIERIVDVYRHHPKALIAPVDIYYECKQPDMKNKVNWWGLWEHDIIGRESWKNIRVLNLGIRESENPYDWETNYAACPRKMMEELNGAWEFFDDGLGYDNTEVAYRALRLGYKLIVDDTNICKCINLWPWIGGTPQNGINRERVRNNPRWAWFIKQTDLGKIPTVRDEKLDASIHLSYTIPDEIGNDKSAKWIEKHTEELMKNWKDL